MKRWMVVAGGAVLAAAVLGAWVANRLGRLPAPRATIEASGRVEGDNVMVSRKIGGRIARLLVAEGDSVKQRQLIAVLSADDLAAAVRQAEAQVASAGAQVLQTRSQVSVLTAQVGQAETSIALADAQVRAQRQQAEANLAAALAAEMQARRDLAWADALERDGAIARADVEVAATRLHTASAQLDAARGHVVVTEVVTPATGEEIVS